VLRVVGVLDQAARTIEAVLCRPAVHGRTTVRTPLFLLGRFELRLGMLLRQVILIRDVDAMMFVTAFH
jgi:hypothetical protein